MRCGTTVYPAAANASTSANDGSRPFTGETVTVSVTSLGTCSSTFSSAPVSGITS